MNLFFGVPKFGEVVDGIEYCSLISNTCIKVVLLPTLINTDALKYQPFWESRLNRAYLKDWVYMKRSGTHWCKVFFHSTPYNVTPDNKITSDITLDKLWTVNDIVVNLFLLRMVYNGQKHSSGINVCIVVDIKIEYFRSLKEVCMSMLRCRWLSS